MQSPPKWIYVAIAVGCTVLGIASIDFSSDLTRSTAEKLLKQRFAEPRHSKEFRMFSLTTLGINLYEQEHKGIVRNISREQLSALTTVFENAIAEKELDFPRLDREVKRVFDNNFALDSHAKHRIEELRSMWHNGFVKGFDWQLSRDMIYNLLLSARGNVKDDLKTTCVQKPEQPQSCEYLAQTITFDRVTGIIGDDSEKRVEYRVNVSPTEFAKRVAAAAGAPVPQQQFGNRFGIFIKYDDGWRQML